MKKIAKKIIYYLLKVFYIFPLKKTMIYILSFQGKPEYAFDGKAIVEYSNNNNLGYKFVWGYKGKKPSKKHKNVKYVKINTIKGMYYLLTCKTFITNINPFTYVPYRKKQLLINTWHGFGPKKGGKYSPGFDEKQYNMSKCFLTTNDYYTNVLRRDFMFRGEILPIGFCKNDVLFDKIKVERIREETKEKYNLKDKKIILYAPTFRENFQHKKDSIDFNRIIEELEKKTHKKWIVALRTHPMIASKLSNNDECVINLSAHEDVHDLICMSDVLISDYSSVMWDFSITRRPIIMYIDDFDKYENDRSVYDYFYELPYYKAKNMEEMIEVIRNYNAKEYINKVDAFFRKCNSYENGNACKKLYEYIEINNGGIK